MPNTKGEGEKREKKKEKSSRLLSNETTIDVSFFKTASHIIL
jgi:hypothetical protein